jgi:hypothetical protein
MGMKPDLITDRDFDRELGCLNREIQKFERRWGVRIVKFSEHMIGYRYQQEEKNLCGQTGQSTNKDKPNQDPPNKYASSYTGGGPA